MVGGGEGYFLIPHRGPTKLVCSRIGGNRAGGTCDDGPTAIGADVCVGRAVDGQAVDGLSEVDLTLTVRRDGTGAARDRDEQR